MRVSAPVSARPVLRPLCAVLLLTGLLPAAPALAAFSSSATASATASTRYLQRQPTFAFEELFSPDNGSDADAVLSTWNASQGQSFAGTESLASAQASAQALAGGLHVRALAASNSRFDGSGTNNQEFDTAARSGAGAEASFTDTVLFGVQGMAAGSTVSITYGVNVSGALGWSGNAGVTSSTLSWDVRIGNQGDGRSASMHSLGGADNGGIPLVTGPYSVTATVTLGQSVDLYMRLLVGATAGAGVACRFDTCLQPSFAEASAVADFSHTLGWGGITGLRDSQGQALDPGLLSVQSDSGFDYRTAYVAAAVPEPGAAILMLAGLPLLLRRARRTPSA